MGKTMKGSIGCTSATMTVGSEFRKLERASGEAEGHERAIDETVHAQQHDPAIGSDDHARHQGSDHEEDEKAAPGGRGARQEVGERIAEHERDGRDDRGHAKVSAMTPTL